MILNDTAAGILKLKPAASLVIPGKRRDAYAVKLSEVIVIFHAASARIRQ
jgi:hypothetical protein